MLHESSVSRLACPRGFIRLVQVRAILVLIATPMLACIKYFNVQCIDDSTCTSNGQGMCTAIANSDRWCAYPDPNCASGFRFSDEHVGDGVSGTCLPQQDAGTDAPTTMPPRSCVGLPASCGANKSDDCCASPEVPGGMFYRSYDLAGDVASGDTKSPATISSFRLDKYEVPCSASARSSPTREVPSKRRPSPDPENTQVFLEAGGKRGSTRAWPRTPTR